MGRLYFLFIAVPLIELALLIEVGSLIGTGPTIGLVVVTAIAGASLARWQGLSALARIRAVSATGRLPAEPVFDGLLILVAALLLITPGILTDAVGFLLLVPFVRRRVRKRIGKRFGSPAAPNDTVEPTGASSRGPSVVIDQDGNIVE